jgi:acetyl esterase/lipase
VVAENVRPASGAVVPLWPQGAPGALGTNPADIPSVTVYLPPKAKANGCGVVICPGGAYTVLAFDHEGVQVARWLNSIGVAGFVLKYRLGPRYQHPAPLQDAQRALRWVRANAGELGVATNRVGILGFSAGGHLTSSAGTHFDAGNPTAVDPVDRQSCRPDFMAPCYAVISMSDTGHSYSRKMLLGDKPDPAMIEFLSSEKQVTTNTPPAFLWTTSEDYGVAVQNSLLFYQALQKARVPAELHIFAYGEHGLGLAPGDPATGSWPEAFARWLRRSSFLTDTPRCTVAGQVLIDGKPLNRGWITFVPGNGNEPVASYYITKDGKYSIPRKGGPSVGRQQIEIRQLATAFLSEPSIDDAKLFTKATPHALRKLHCDLQSGTNLLNVTIKTK